MIRLGVIGNRDYPDLARVLQRILSLGSTLGIEMHLEATLRDLAEGQTLPALVAEDVDVLLTLGGDGTLLRGARFLGGRFGPAVGEALVAGRGIVPWNSLHCRVPAAGGEDLVVGSVRPPPPQGAGGNGSGAEASRRQPLAAAAEDGLRCFGAADGVVRPGRMDIHGDSLRSL